jgi:hypothetical protein
MSGLTKRRASTLVFVLAVLVAALALPVSPANAVFRHKPTTPQSGQTSTTNTDMTLTGLGPGQSVTGWIANADNPFDPVSEGYPPSNPATGFTPQNEGFAGVIHGTPTGGGPNLDLYCIDPYR